MLQVLWKLKSTKRKTIKKQNVLIALDRSIASVQGIELAMLFSHADFDVKFILFEGAENYLSSVVIKEATAHSPWSSSNKPGWLKADIKYVTGIYIGSNQSSIVEQTQEALQSRSRFIDYMLTHCDSLKLITNFPSELTEEESEKIEIISIPENMLQMRDIFQRILTATTRLAVSKSLYSPVTFYIAGDFTNINYVKELRTAFTEYGLKETKNTEEDIFPTSKIVFKNTNKQLDFIFENNEEKEPTRSLIFVNKHKNGLLITDRTGIRLIPHFSSKSCFSRFVEYLMVELSRE